MYKRTLMLMVVAALVFSVVQPAVAFQASAPLKPGTPQASGASQAISSGGVPAGGQLLNHTAADLRLQGAKTAAINGIDAAIRALNADEAALGRSRLTDDQKATISSQIQSNVTWFESRKSDVQSSKDVAGVLQSSRLAANRWNQVNAALKKEIGLMACDNLDATLGDARKASDIASGKIQSLKAGGNDTGRLERALASYDGHIDNATTDVEVARSEFNDIGAPNDGHFLMGLAQIDVAQKDLKSSYGDLKNIYRLLYRNNVSSGA